MSARIPERGRPWDELLERLSGYCADDVDYRGGRSFGLVYHLGQEHSQGVQRAHALYAPTNALNPMAFKSLKRMESEVVRMAAGMLKGDERVVGALTSGGTESCMLAVLAYRERYRALHPRRGRPQLILPESAHVAFDKACHYFGVQPVRVPLDRGLRADARAVARRISRRTAAIVASAPSYPHGIVDPIEQLGRLAARRGVPLHVDACLGGFLLPWIEAEGHPVPRFDFRVPGVRSMSADVHKFGFAAKGASLLLWRDMEDMQHQFFVAESWPGGVYASPTLLGTRPGGPIAASWAAMQALGCEGYRAQARSVMATSRQLQQGIRAMPELEVLGEPPAGVFAWRSTDPRLSSFALADQLERRGWHVDRQHRPDCVHLTVMPAHEAIADSYLEDLRAALVEVRADPELATQGGAAMYGMISKVPFRGVVRDQVRAMMAELYGPEGRQPDLQQQADNADAATRAGLLFLKARRRLSLGLHRLRQRQEAS